MSLLLALVSVLTACDDDIAKIQDGMTQKVTITASLLAGGEESRALFKDENGKEHDGTGYVNRYLFLLYDGTAAASKLQHVIEIDLKKVVMPYYTELPASTVTRGAVMIANADLSDLGGYAVIGTSTLNDLNYATKEVEATYNNPDKPEDPYNFTWSDYKEIASADRQITFALNPNMAKVTVTVTNNAVNNVDPTDKIEIVNIQVKNVPNRVRFAQNALEDDDCGLLDNASSADITGYSYIDYEIEPLSLVTQGANGTVSWFLPYNFQGSTPARPNAPANATYIEVDGVRRLDYMDTAYKIYPGTVTTSGQYTDNFNVVSDHQYTINVTITKDGLNYNATNNINSGDNQSTSPEKVKFPAGSNCYMVHPKISNTNGYVLYELPVHEQINRFWGHKEWYTGEANEITDETEWVAEVIWQDIPASVMGFSNSTGTGNLTTSYTGKGQTPLYFKLKKLDCYGNIVVGVRKKSEDNKYLWSWHLWVTDYNPDAAISPSQAVAKHNKFLINAMYIHNDGSDPYGKINDLPYIVDAQGYRIYDKKIPGYTLTYGGNVQHYKHTFYDYWGNPLGTSISGKVWDTTNGSVSYYDRWIMDRNLGAQAPGNGDLEDPWQGFGLYYQYGRKDPFPYVNTSASPSKMQRRMYDINGYEISKWIVDQSYSINGYSGSLSNGVRNPKTFYAGLNKGWAADATNNHWYDIEENELGEKSIFDPCPPGWCIPVSDAFHFATNSQPQGVYGDSEIDYSIKGASFAVYINSRGWNQSSSAVNPCYNRNYAIISSLWTYDNGVKKHLDSVFPIQGYIKDDGSTFVGLNETARDAIRGCYWTVDKSSDKHYGRMLQIQPTTSSYSVTETSYWRYPENGVYNYFYYHRFNPPLIIQNLYASRGQNVRCIQEPIVK